MKEMDRKEFLTELNKKFEDIQHRNNVHISAVRVYSSFNTDELKLKSSIGKLYIAHYARSFCLDSERFVTYTLNPRIKDCVEEFRRYLIGENIKHSIYRDDLASYGYNIIISEGCHENK